MIQNSFWPMVVDHLTPEQFAKKTAQRRAEALEAARIPAGTTTGAQSQEESTMQLLKQRSHHYQLNSVMLRRCMEVAAGSLQEQERLWWKAKGYHHPTALKEDPLRYDRHAQDDMEEEEGPSMAVMSRDRSVRKQCTILGVPILP